MIFNLVQARMEFNGENKLNKYFKEQGFFEVLQKLSQSVDYIF